jgi:hypothetical protein
MLYLSSTLLTSVHALPYARLSHVWISNMMISSLTSNSICILKWLVLASQFLALRYDHMMGTGNAIFTLVWRDRCNCSLYTVHWNILWHLFITPQCSWLLVWASCYIVSSCVGKINIKKILFNVGSEFVGNTCLRALSVLSPKRKTEFIDQLMSVIWSWTHLSSDKKYMPWICVTITYQEYLLSNPWFARTSDIYTIFLLLCSFSFKYLKVRWLQRHKVDIFFSG